MAKGLDAKTCGKKRGSLVNKVYEELTASTIPPHHDKRLSTRQLCLTGNASKKEHSTSSNPSQPPQDNVSQLSPSLLPLPSPVQHHLFQDHS